MKRRRKAHAQPVREKSDTAQIATIGMGAAILLGVIYLFLRNDPGVPAPTGSQVPTALPPPPPPQPFITVQTTYSVPMSDNPFTLKVGDTVAIVPPTPGGDWGTPTIAGPGGLQHTATITPLGVQPDGSYAFRADGAGVAMINYGYSTASGTQNHSQIVTVTP
jgi:hypothetical protein